MLAQTVRELPFGTVFFSRILADDTGAPGINAPPILNEEDKYERSRCSWLRVRRFTACG